MDGGFIYQGYLTDLLRCGVIGSPTKEQEAYYNASRDANMDAEIRIHPKCEELSTQRDIRRCVKLDDDRIVIVEGNATRVSADDGRSWSEPRPIHDGPPPGTPNTEYCNGLFLKTRDGVLLYVYLDEDTSFLGWDEKRHDWPENLRRDVWSIRSLDEGATWADRQKLPPEWVGGCCGAVLDGIQTASGRVVVPIQPVLRDPPRWGTSTIISTDNGKTWDRGNLIDLGGNGNHDGGFEATIEELTDSRLMMLLRTNLDVFWEAYSSDSGRYWRELRPSGIDASTAPGIMKRLASGRLVLVWNLLYPEGETSYYRYAGEGAEIERSQHRREISIAFSEDDAKTWSKPVVVAAADDTGEGRAELAYPMVFERRPGELWVSTHLNLRAALNKSMETEVYETVELGLMQVRLREEDFVRWK